MQLKDNIVFPKPKTIRALRENFAMVVSKTAPERIRIEIEKMAGL